MKRLIISLAVLCFVVELLAAPSGTEHKKNKHRLNYDKDNMHHKMPKHLRGKTPSPFAVNWWQWGQDDLQRQLSLVPVTGVARNVIIFIGDGMGVATEAAARMLLAQERIVHPSDATLSWDSLPYTGVARTYNTDVQVPDSAGTATAIFSGEKARDGVIGVNQNVVFEDCDTLAGNELPSILHHSIAADKWTGVVTTARITHATPAATYAHSPCRDWEGIADVPADVQGRCQDIAYQLINNANNTKIRVILGGGRQFFLPEDVVDPEHADQTGERTDGLNLINTWLNKRAAEGLAPNQYSYVWNKAAFDSVNPATTDYLLGLFEEGHMKYEVERSTDPAGEPSLTEMVEKAISILQRSPNGFFLMVEGSRIDHAHHDTNAYRALYEVLELSKAVQKAKDMTSESDTLLISTADHSHTFTFNGYPSLTNDIFGLVDTMEGDDGKPFLTLSYANGPGWYDHRQENDNDRKDLTGDDTADIDFLQDAAVPLGSETHGGDDVIIHARGPLAHLLTGVHEQNYIGHLAMYASCVGPNKAHCAQQSAKH